MGARATAWLIAAMPVVAAQGGMAHAQSAAAPIGAMPDARITRVPVLGSTALDPTFHDSMLYAPDPLPIETGAALDAMVVDQVPRAALVGPPTVDRDALDRLERGGVGRLARRIGGDDIIVPVWTLHFGARP